MQNNRIIDTFDLMFISLFKNNQPNTLIGIVMINNISMLFLSINFISLPVIKS